MGNSCLGEFKSEHGKEIHVGWSSTVECPFEIYGHEMYETSHYSAVFVQQRLVALRQ